jgi:pimeloyl-ACP methyl ester carboxylesterase
MSSWHSGEIEANGIRLHYTRTGGTKPALVLAHGFSDDGLCWTPVAEVLAQDYDVVMVDARGHGRSEGPEQGYAPNNHADDLAGLIRGLGLRRPAVLGHSMGAGTALVLAGAYPDLPGAILLEDPPAWWMSDAARDASADNERRVRMYTRIIELKRKTRDELIAGQLTETPHWTEGELGPWADAKLRFSFNVLNRSDPAAIDWAATLRGIRCPALLITGDPAQGAIITEESGAALQALVPQLRIVHIPEAGHSIRRDQFDRYIKAIRGFLAEQR